MSFVDIVLDRDGYGAAVMLITSIDSSILKQWLLDLDSCIFVRFVIRRIDVNRERIWWLICFELLNLPELALNTAAEIYDLFFRATVLGEWHPDVIVDSDKMFGVCGSAVQKGCAATDGDCRLMAKFMEEERKAIQLRHRCSVDFQERLSQDPKFATPKNMQILAKDYGLCGGRWLIFIEDDRSNNLTGIERQHPNCVYRNIEIARNLWSSLFDGTIGASGIIEYIDLHNYKSSSIVGVGNRCTTAKFQNRYGCLHDDRDVKAVLEEIRPLVPASNGVHIKYKPEVYSVCNIVYGNNHFLKPTVYTAVSNSNTSEFFKVRPVRVKYKHNQGFGDIERLTAVIDDTSPLHPCYECHADLRGHEYCMRSGCEKFEPGFSPPSFAHLFCYTQVLAADSIPVEKRCRIYEEIEKLTPAEFSKRFTQLMRTSEVISYGEKELHLADMALLWAKNCKVFRSALLATGKLPIRFSETGTFTNGSGLKKEEESQMFTKVSDYDILGVAWETARATLADHRIVNATLTCIGDDLARKLSKSFGGEFEPETEAPHMTSHFDVSKFVPGNDGLREITRLVKGLEFGNECCGVILATGASELARDVPASEYGLALEALVQSLKDSGLRLIFLLPSVHREKQELWEQYVEEHFRLGEAYPEIEFLAWPREEWTGRNFVGAMYMGYKLDPDVCTDRGFTDYGYCKFAHFLLDVIKVPLPANFFPHIPLRIPFTALLSIQRKVSAESEFDGRRYISGTPSVGESARDSNYGSDDSWAQWSCNGPVDDEIGRARTTSGASWNLPEQRSVSGNSLCEVRHDSSTSYQRRSRRPQRFRKPPAGFRSWAQHRRYRRMRAIHSKRNCGTVHPE